MTKPAYFETHDPPHCPTCGCGMEPSQADRDAIFSVADHLVETAPLHGHGKAYDEWFATREKYRASKRVISPTGGAE